MYTILNSNIALRSWRLVPYAYYIKGVSTAFGLKKEEFELLLLCDGQTDLPDSTLLQHLIGKRLVSVCEKGEQSLSDWQRHKNCDNRYFPKMNWMITGKCNYNCLHCFNAADNTPLMGEWTLAEAEKLLEEARDCGVNAFTITGGEPMLHRHFFEIIEGIYTRGMFVEELNTNGYFINQEALDRLKGIGCFPIIKISFDGVGHHDWMRNRKGAEENALQAMKLCIQNGFCVMAQTNLYHGNEESMLPTAELLDRMGVSRMRIIRTSEAPRWEENAKGRSLSYENYYSSMLDFAGEYKRSSHNMEVDIWQLMMLYPRAKEWFAHPVAYTEGEYRDSLPVCKGNRGMIAIDAEGNVYPCHQQSGYYKQHGWTIGNVRKDGLRSLLTSGAYLDEVCTTVKALADQNEKCAGCKWFRYCCGGCRALALLTSSKFGPDLSKCLFWENGYYKKAVEIMNGWKNIREISDVT